MRKWYAAARVFWFVPALAACNPGSDDGELTVSVRFTSEAGTTCAVVSGISAFPLEARVGSSLRLEGHSTRTEGLSYRWSGAGGAFSAGTSAMTDYACKNAGDHTLTFAIAQPGCDTSSMTVRVKCTADGQVTLPSVL